MRERERRERERERGRRERTTNGPHDEQQIHVGITFGLRQFLNNRQTTSILKYRDSQGKY